MFLPSQRKVHFVRFNAGTQDIISVPLDSNGDPVLPSSATYGIFDIRFPEDDSTDREIVAAGTAGTIDTATSTTTAAAGAGQSDRTLLAMTDGSDFDEGHRYMLTDLTTGRRRLVTIENKNGNNLYLASNLVKLWASGSTLEGIEVTASFPSAEANDEEDTVDSGGGPYAIDWTWTGPEQTRQRELIWVRRNPEMPYLVTLDDCEFVDPLLRTQLQNMNGAAGKFLYQAHADLWAELRAVGLNPMNWHGGENAEEYIKHQWAMLGRGYLGGDEGEYNDRMSVMHGKRARQLLHTFTVPGRNPINTSMPDESEDHAEQGTSTVKPDFWGLS